MEFLLGVGWVIDLFDGCWTCGVQIIGVTAHALLMRFLPVVCRAFRVRCLSVRIAYFVGGLALKHGHNAFQSTQLD